MNLLKFFEKSYKFYGLEIGEDDLRIVSYDDKAMKPISFWRFETGSNFTQFGFRREAIEKGLAELVRVIKPDESTRFNLTIPASFTVPKKIQLSSAKPSSQFEEMLSQIPFPLDSVYYDYVLKQLNSENFAIFLAVKREIVDTLTSIFTDFGLRLGILESEYFSLLNAISFCKPDMASEVSIIININQTYSVFVVSQFGIPVSCSDARLGYRNVLEEKLPEVGIEWSSVFKWLIGEKTDLQPSIKSEITTGFSSLADEVYRNLNLLRHLPELKEGVDKIYVLGALANQPDFHTALRDRIGIETMGFDPFSNLMVDQKDLGFTKALGCSIRRFGDKQ